MVSQPRKPKFFLIKVNTWIHGQARSVFKLIFLLLLGVGEEETNKKIKKKRSDRKN
jgi:hypothetical protein